ncbi:hypothetical protein Pla123a_44180 [Posidoniimonas polymericola]|uniref:HAMP domain-containing protein n=1 Tax=Posidoniimonas polymericola TaxID=2528002 RepID=A0A5C5XWU1_9BACT|nr:hypothetical protein [Posidoniimonas polymericola]TWT66989.1 hypothetical protein Pla123a_44180 [Posidoniimonas polymericola]
MKKTKRRRLLVDSKLQGALLCRVTGYWCLSLLVLVALVAVQVTLFSKEVDWSVTVNRTLQAFGPSLLATLLLLPLLLLDALRFSLRFAGPMQRLRGEVHKLANGEWDGPIKFRGRDYWHDLGVEINRVAEELEQLRAEHAAASEGTQREEVAST